MTLRFLKTRLKMSNPYPHDVHIYLPKRLWTYHNFHQGWWNSYLEIYFKIFLYIFMSALSMRTTFALGKKCFPWKKIQFLLALSGIRTPKLQEPSLCYLADFFEYYVILVSLHPLCAFQNGASLRFFFFG